MAITIPRERRIAIARYSSGFNVPIVNNDGSGLGGTITELLRVSVPSEPGPVTLHAQVAFQATTAGQQSSAIAAIVPVANGAVGSLLTAIEFKPELNFGAASGTNAEAFGRHIKGLWAELDPSATGKEYVLGAVRLSGANAANMGGTASAVAKLAAYRQWG